MTGRNHDRKSFWIEKDKSECTKNSMVTSEITIQNGQIISSACDKCPDSPDGADLCESEIFCDQTWTRFYQSRNENGIEMANIHDAFADFYDPFVNGLISEQCSNTSTIDVRLRKNKKDFSVSGFIFDINNQEVKCEGDKNNGQACPEFEIRFCCERNNRNLEWISQPREYNDLNSKLFKSYCLPVKTHLSFKTYLVVGHS